jgi:Rod binding domain-containing protein
MDIVSISMADAQAGKLQTTLAPDVDQKTKSGTDKSAETARQFEAIMVRQLLSESMKNLAGSGSGSQVYGYFVTNSLADAMTKGGGIGLTHILQAQLKQ